MSKTRWILNAQLSAQEDVLTREFCATVKGGTETKSEDVSQARGVGEGGKRQNGDGNFDIVCLFMYLQSESRQLIFTVGVAWEDR